MRSPSAAVAAAFHFSRLGLRLDVSTLPPGGDTPWSQVAKPAFGCGENLARPENPLVHSPDWPQ